MGIAKNITPGTRFHRLTVISPAMAVNGQSYSLCGCDCGSTVTVKNVRLRREHTRSCGCLRLDERLWKTHGMSRSAEYATWMAMRNRCERPSYSGWKNYGGRGISVCERWQIFDNFFADMGSKPSARHSIDRIDNNGDYSPSNCRWATRSQQAESQRRPHERIIHAFGDADTISNWANRLGVRRETLTSRVWRTGSIEDSPRSRLRVDNIRKSIDAV